MLKVVSNTTPIISLLAISKLELLKEMYGRIIIPRGVFDEIEQGRNKQFYEDLSAFDWIDIRKLQDTRSLKYITDLDKGEAEVIVLANEIEADLVIIDEKAGREYASYFGLKYTGTIGILLKAKQLGLVEKVSPLLSEMKENGIWLSQKFIDKIISLAGE